MIARAPLTILATCLVLGLVGCGGTLVPMDDDMAYSQPPAPVAQPAPLPIAPSSPAPYSGDRPRDNKADLLTTPVQPIAPKVDALSPPPVYSVPAPVAVADDAATAACKGWLVNWMKAPSKSLLNKGAQLEALWHEPVAKPEKLFPGALPPVSDSSIEWFGVETQKGDEILGCKTHLKVATPQNSVAFYARFDLVDGPGGHLATHVTVILEIENDDAKGVAFDRIVGDCGIFPYSGVTPQKLCGLITLYDTAIGNPQSDYWLIRDISELLVFDGSGHLEDVKILGMVKDDGNAMGPMDIIDQPQPIDLNLGTEVVSVYEEKVKPLGGGHPSAYGYNDCTAFMIFGKVSYYTYDGKALVEIFSQDVDVYPDAPCASDYQIDKYKDLVVDVIPVCNDPSSPCELHLHFDQVTPTDKLWDEVWKFNGKKYVKSK